ncbi:MAG: cation:dicarboxylase symporter family transporter, partial [Pseudomonadota bacterium]|nr:cation:dicarboxylase symporter family transporter [Pseudomonadota bacterium]
MSLFPAALTPSSPRRLASRLDYLLRGRLWAQILLAMVLGVALGLCLSPSGGALVASDTASLLAAWLALPGRLFLAMIQMVVVPLVLSSIILGITSSGDPKFLKQIGLRIAPYFILTTSVAVFIGCIVALWLQPGQYIDVGAELATGPAPRKPPGRGAGDPPPSV